MIGLFGGMGSIGTRYRAIMDYYGIAYTIFDPAYEKTDWSVPIEKAIIATPTDTHIETLKRIPDGVPVLCEKPVSKSLEEIPLRKETWVVSNYKYVLHICGIGRPRRIWYDFYRTGSDGILWDCCQLIYLHPGSRVEAKSPRWNLNIDGVWIKYRDVEESYCRMIKDFASGKTDRLWDMEEAREMTKAVLKRIEYENTDWDSGKK